MNQASILAASLLLLSGMPTVAQTSLPKMTVVSVGDGDTLRVHNQQGQPVTIRLACVDAPSNRILGDSSLKLASSNYCQ